jgi:hypothetical protein
MGGVRLNWAAALDAGGIHVFHMTDFEANQGEFRRWRERPDDRRRLLNSLLDTIIEFIPEFVGFSELVPSGSAGFREAYETNLVSMLDNTSFQTEPAIVLARHDNYGPTRIAEVVEAAERAFAFKGFKIRTWTVGSPTEFCPLQAADLVAYEIARYGREKELGRPMRYPLRRLHERASSAFAMATL